jgi:pteridine reductase
MPVVGDAFEFVPGAVAPTGRVALVTGGGRGLGAVVVRALAARGFAVAIHCHGSLAAARKLAESLAAAGVPALAVTANLRDESATRAMVHRVADHFGRLDALVTCAGLRQPGPFDEATADDLRAHFDVNCVGTFVAAQEAGAVMAGQETGGSIVTVGDIASERPRPGHVAYLASKGAIAAVTRSLALELTRRNPLVRVNGVLAAAADGADAAVGNGVAVADRVAHAILFLLENDAVTGTLLPVTGLPATPAAGS